MYLSLVKTDKHFDNFQPTPPLKFKDFDGDDDAYVNFIKEFTGRCNESALELLDLSYQTVTNRKHQVLHPLHILLAAQADKGVADYGPALPAVTGALEWIDSELRVVPSRGVSNAIISHLEMADSHRFARRDFFVSASDIILSCYLTRETFASPCFTTPPRDLGKLMEGLFPNPFRIMPYMKPKEETSSLYQQVTRKWATPTSDTRALKHEPLLRTGAELNNVLVAGPTGGWVESAAFSMGVLSSPDTRELLLDSLVSLAPMPGMLESLMMQLVEEAPRTPLVVRDLQRATGQTGAQAVMALDQVMMYLLRSDIPVVATCGTGNVKSIEDSIMGEVFHVVRIDETTLDETKRLLGAAPYGYTGEYIEFAHTISTRYLTEMSQPTASLRVLATAKAGTGRDMEDRLLNATSLLSGVPIDKLKADDKVRLSKLEEEMGARVIGQPEALTAVASAVRRGRLGVADPTRPIGTFLFLGPTGVGKTEVAKTLAATMFDGESSLIRLDMSEFQAEHQVARLIGSPPGYIGYEEGGQLTEAVRAKPHSVVLFDEVEKAHPKVFDICLQIFDDGRLTDGAGKTVDFSNTIIIMTSNIGSKHILDVDLTEQESTALIGKELVKAFRPEMLNRIDETVLFHRLNTSAVAAITELELKKVVDRLSVKIDIDPSVTAQLAERGFNPTMGARPIKRAIQSHLVNPLMSWLLENDADHIVVGTTNETITFGAK